MISIIGGGPSGNYAAYLLAKNGFKVNVYEEHKTIGRPVQCTGLITASIDDVVKIDDGCIINKIGNVRLVAPDGKELFLKLKKKNYVVDRVRFDKFFCEMASAEGAKYVFGKKLLDFRENGEIEMLFENGRAKTEVLIGADGVNSAVNRDKMRFVIGKQGRFKGTFEDDTFTVHLGIGSFSWIVPENKKTARIGVIGRDVNNAYNELMKKGKFKFIESQSGTVPVYDPRLKTQIRNVYLLGDAAGMVKATTYGGILYGLMAAQELNKALKNDDDYDRLWRARFGKELHLSLLIRRVLDRMKSDNYNELIETFSKEQLKKLISEHDRDFPSKFLFKLILKEPRLLKYMRLLL